MSSENARGPVNVSAAVGAVNQNPPESSAVESETTGREQVAREAEAPPESSAEHGVTESHIDQPRSGTSSPDAIGSGPPD
ncbi:MAG: hypothetical protein JO028_20605 [Acidobacteriaceae bacterium]|nr:hypothetical protein [Acidobacteriaceae bacterium]